MKRAALLALLALLAVLAACAPNIPKPTQLDADRGQTSLVELERGRKLYVKRCGGCHSLYEPGKYEPGVWPEKVEAMRERAKLAADDQAAITRYLATMSRR